MKILWNQEIYHFGIKGRSGRYPAGSGENPKTGPRANRKKIAKIDKVKQQQKEVFHPVKKNSKNVVRHPVKTTRGISRYLRHPIISRREAKYMKAKKQLAANTDPSKTSDLNKKYARRSTKLWKARSKEYDRLREKENKLASNLITDMTVAGAKEGKKKPDVDSIVRSGNAKLVLKNKQYLSNKQMKEALQRINAEQQLKKISSAESTKYLKRVESFVSVMDRSSKVLKTFNDSAKIFEEVLGNSSKAANIKKAVERETAAKDKSKQRIYKIKSDINNKDKKQKKNKKK